MSAVWTVEEFSTSWLDGFDRSSLPRQVSNAIRVVTDGARCGLEVAGVVGTVPLLNGELLRIRPKVGDYNFVRMMLRADGLYADVKSDFEDLAILNTNESEAPLWLVCRALFRSLSEISRNSLSFRRLAEIARGDFAGGPLLPLRTAQLLAIRAEKPVVFSRTRRSYDTPEHRMLGRAASLGLALLPNADQLPHAGSARSWSHRFGSGFLRTDLSYVARNLKGERYGGSRGYYARALALAQILLGDAGYTAEGSPQGIAGEGFLVDAAQLFERFIRSVLVEYHQSKGVIVTKGGGIKNQSLYLDGSFELEPDFVYQDRSVIRLIADAKYKRPDSKDHYQMLCYLTRYRVKTGVFFFPVQDKSNEEAIKRTTPEGIAVWELPLPLSNLDLTEDILRTTLERLGTH